jgi:predicted Holliday junction resolvase-like endonuclease
MDPSPIFTEAAKLGFVVLLLLAAVYLLVKRQDRLENQRMVREAAIEEERKERERQQRESCAKEIASLVADVRALQSSRYEDARSLLVQGMDVLRINAESFGRLVDIQKQTASGQHRTLSDR